MTGYGTDTTVIFTTRFKTTAEAILSFITARLADTESKGAFTSDQLRFYVTNNTVGGVSPSSADRVLRNLRQQNKLNYIVLNRGKSLYRAMPVRAAEPFIAQDGV